MVKMTYSGDRADLMRIANAYMIRIYGTQASSKLVLSPRGNVYQRCLLCGFDVEVLVVAARTPMRHTTAVVHNSGGAAMFQCQLPSTIT